MHIHVIPTLFIITQAREGHRKDPQLLVLPIQGDTAQQLKTHNRDECQKLTYCMIAFIGHSEKGKTVVMEDPGVRGGKKA